MAKPVFTDIQIANQLTRDGTYWYGDNGNTTIEYAFSTSLGDWNGAASNASALDAVQQQWVTTALSQLSDNFNLTFNLVAEPVNTATVPPLDIIQFVNNPNEGTFSQSWSYTSGGVAFNNVVLDSTWASNQSANLEYGSYGYLTILHEILHSLGLEHPGDYDAGNGGPITYAADAEFEQDTHRYTIMSYFNAVEDGSGSIHYDTIANQFVYARTPMVYDLFAMTNGDFDGQFGGYGANSTTRVGNSTYGYNVSADVSVEFDFTAHGAPVLTIYDTGGIDTLDLSGDTVADAAVAYYDAAGTYTGFSEVTRTSTVIDLREGHYSSTHGMTNNIGIAIGTEIENAIGTQFSDYMIGNDLNNDLNGGAGNDLLLAGAGADTLTGGSGFDIFAFDEAAVNQNKTDTITDYSQADGDIIALINYTNSYSDINVVTDATNATIELASAQGSQFLKLADAFGANAQLTSYLEIFDFDAVSAQTLYEFEIPTAAFQAGQAVDSTEFTGYQVYGFDVLSQFNWAKKSSDYDHTGTKKTDFVLFDDNTQHKSYYDWDNNDPYVQFKYILTATGLIDQTITDLDDGTKTWLYTDNANAYNYQTYNYVYNAAGQNSQIVINYDAGNAFHRYTDVDMAQTWSEYNYYYDAMGNTTQTIVEKDNLDTVRVYNDVDASQTWDTFLYQYDSSDEHYFSKITWDAGNYRHIFYDVADANSWDQYIIDYDINGNIVNDYYI